MGSVIVPAATSHPVGLSIAGIDDVITGSAEQDVCPEATTDAVGGQQRRQVRRQPA